MGHVQIMYFWNSLDANMCLKINSIKKYNGTIDNDRYNRTESAHIGLS